MQNKRSICPHFEEKTLLAKVLFKLVVKGMFLPLCSDPFEKGADICKFPEGVKGYFFFSNDQ